MKLKKYFLILFRFLSIILIVFSLYLIFNYIKDNKKNNQIKEEIINNNIVVEDKTNVDGNEFDYLKINFDNLKKYNNDTVGYIKVNNTPIDYPIVQTIDNSYYLTHNFLKEYNKAGWIFADYRNNMINLDKNIIIYGHNRNGNKDMFGSLKDTLSNNWYDNKQNKYLYFSTIDNNYIGEIFSIYKIDSRYVNLDINFSSDEEFMQYIESAKSKSIFNFNVEITSNDNILTLYTCDSNLSYRIILHAKLIKI